MCLTPLVLKAENSPAELTKKVPCGKCRVCLKRHAAGWTFRLLQEAQNSSTCSFVTLTYADEQIPVTQDGYQTLVKEDLQKFFKRLRKRTHNKIKYYACGEYGKNTNRPHYHMIAFNLPYRWLQNWDQPDNPIVQEWGKGLIHIGQGNELTMRYVTKYVMKKQQKRQYNSELPEFAIMSKKLGIKFLTDDMKKYLKSNLKGYVEINGYKVALPRYFREKVFTDEERKLLAKVAQDERERKFKKTFNGDITTQDQWVNNQIRKHEREIREERDKI